MRILVAIDSSECSFTALSYALDLYEMGGVELDVVHVTDFKTDATEALVAKAREMLADAGIDTEPEVVTNLGLDTPKASVRVGQRIVELATERGADQIVVGRHGETGMLEKIILGSTSETVVKGAEIPVTVIPA
ncbi:MULTISPECIES: universal stress protein [unclassified Haladaptatus]|uniref:universal stress protein n=1 Tax=unclassified Haladaptatus TaxID=2622732 RepID=UPI0023E7F391|nr:MULTISPECIES: universal stress protein [unclassified Haladaptatus]